MRGSNVTQADTLHLAPPGHTTAQSLFQLPKLRVELCPTTVRGTRQPPNPLASASGRPSSILLLGRGARTGGKLEITPEDLAVASVRADSAKTMMGG
jgi:hypothetical protein